LVRIMTIDDKTIHRIAHLARIGMDEDHIAIVQKRLNGIMNWVEQLNELDTDKVDPLFSMHLHEMPRQPDIVSDGNYANAIVANAPDATLNMFSVPKVVE